MSSKINVDTSSVRTGGAEFDTAGVETVALINDAMHRLSAFNGVWGRDETGQQFELVYAPPRDGLMQGLEAIPQLLKNYAGGMGSTAAVYDRANDLTEDLVRGTVQHIRSK